MEQHRRLAAILFTDIIGFTASMQQNENLAVAEVQRYQAVLKNAVKAYGGKIVNNYGDGNLCTFPSATQALDAAILIQQELRLEPRVPLRIGLHIGEIRMEKDHLFGDGVNLASRIQSLGIENSILFSNEFYQQVKNHPAYSARWVGSFDFKNIEEPVVVYALANEGFTIPEKTALAGKLKNSATKKWPAVVAIVLLLVVILASWLWWQNNRHLTANDGETTIAILPFKNIGTLKEENEPFCIGIGLELQKKLEWIGGLTTISAQSVEKYRGTATKVQTISRELGGVQYVVEGAVQRNGNRIMVFVSLIQASTGKQVWSDSYPGNVVDIFALQDSIAQQIATNLSVKITPNEKSRLHNIPSNNADALNRYNEALSYYVKLAYAFHPSFPAEITENALLYADYKNILTLCDQALAFDRGMAGALQLKAKAMIFRHRYFSSHTGVADSIRTLCRQALQLQPDAQEIYIILSQLQPGGSKLKTDAVTGLMPSQLLEKALQLNPNNFDVNWELGYYYAWKEFDPEKSIRHFKTALRVDPLSIWTAKVNLDMSGPYWNIYDYPHAEKYLKKAISLSTNSSISGEAMMRLCIIYLQTGKPDSVMHYANQLLAQGDKNALYYMAEVYCLFNNDCEKACQLYSEVWKAFPHRTKDYRWGYALWKTGKKEEALIRFQKGIQEFQFLDSTGLYDFNNYDVAAVYSFLGQKEKALDILKNMNQRTGWNTGMLSLVKTDPLYDNIRHDPQFKEIVARETAFRAHWLEKIRKMEAEGSL